MKNSLRLRPHDGELLARPIRFRSWAISGPLFATALCALVGCEDARRVYLPGPEEVTDPPLVYGEIDQADSDGRDPSGVSEERPRDPGTARQCDGETIWSRLTPRRLRPLTQAELEQSWSRLITSNTTTDHAAESCPDYTFTIHRDQLGEHQSAQTIHVAGDFNNWPSTIDAGGWAMTLSDDGQRWRLDQRLPTGRHLYKFVIDEQHWLPDPNQSEREDDGFGGVNSVAVVQCEVSDTSHGLSASEARSIMRSALRNVPMTPRPSHYPFSGHVKSSQTSPERISALLDASQALIDHLPDALGRQIECLREHPEFDRADLDLDMRLAGLSRSCLTEVIDLVGSQLHRAPLAPTVQTRAVELAMTESPSIAIRVLALSPAALYRSELGSISAISPDQRDLVGATDEANVYALTSLELASALSFALWGGPPDAELLALGAQGALDHVETLRAQAERLLEHPLALQHWGRIGVEWLGVEDALRAPKRGDLFPTLTDQVREAMVAEASALVSTALLGAPALYESEVINSPDLLFGASSDSDNADELRWLNDTLIDYYRLDQALLRLAGDEVGHDVSLSVSDSSLPIALSPYWVGVDESGVHVPRGGILGAGATLLTYAHSDQTSPILRGLFVRERILCQAFGPPPPNAGGVPEVDPNATTRERFRQHSADPSCSGCHRLIDEVGFGFERFDAAGGTRDEEAGRQIETHGTLAGLSSLSDPVESPFVGLGELADLLANSERAQSCLLTQIRRATLGAMSISNGVESLSVVGDSESCHLRALRDRLLAGELSMRQVIVELVLSPEFRLRREAPEED